MIIVSDIAATTYLRAWQELTQPADERAMLEVMNQMPVGWEWRGKQQKSRHGEPGG